MRPVDIRPLTPDDVPAAAAVAVAALPVPAGFDARRPASPWLERRTRAPRRARPRRRAGSPRRTARSSASRCAIVRDGIWGLSLLAVHPDRHARGTGTRAPAGRARPTPRARAARLICARQDPQAMRLYARAGFDLRPCVARRRRSSTAPRSPPACARAPSRRPRGGRGARPRRSAAAPTTPADLALAADAPGARRCCSSTAAASRSTSDGSPIAARAPTDDEAATDLLWSCLAAAPRRRRPSTSTPSPPARTGRSASASTRAWRSRPDGPMFTRGELGPLRPWLPSGALL